MENQNIHPMNEEGSVGPVIATIIILAVIVLGGLYFWHERSASNALDPYATSTDVTSGINNVSSSDDTSSIEADLNSTDTTTVDGTINAS
ncbi:MAG: hypothetical protein JWL80_37 [Parcubacteria group bacterium]|nr:hypothetical protein [Parcubacteria group bacterium]